MRLKIFLLLVVLTSLCYSESQAQIPQVIAYQGYLTSNGIPVTNSGLPASFTLYDSQSGGNPVWNQQSQNVQVSNGYYNALLDFSSGWQVGVNGQDNFTKQYWLQVLINNVNLAPRVQLTSSPSTFNARRADTANVALKLIQDAPIGTIVAYGGNIFKLSQNEQKLGWYICDGRRVRIIDFPEYADVVQNTYGVSDAADSVYLPDYRGLFLRGVNSGFAGNRTDEFADPDAGSRTSMRADGSGNTGNKVGSVESDALQGHHHGSTTTSSIIASPWDSPIVGKQTAGSVTYFSQTIVTDGQNGTPRVSSESRPKNAYVYWIIKVK